MTSVKVCLRAAKALEKMHLPESLKSIGKQAFNKCPALVSIDMPDSVKVINDYAFGGCTGLKSVNFSEKSQLEKLCYGAFGSCTALEQFDFPSSLKEIGGAFVGSGLRNVVVPERMANNDIRFSGCPELRSAVIYGNITALNYTFSNCPKLTDVKFPDSVTELNRTFYGCAELREVKLGSNIAKIGEETFTNSGISNLIIPPSVKKVAYSAFENCSGLVSLIIEDSSEELVFEPVTTVESMYYSCGIISSPALRKIYVGRPVSNVSVTGCSKSLTTVTFGPEVKDIGDSMFVNMIQIKELSIPNTVETIGANAFKGCEGLTSLYLGSSLREIGDHAFDGARNLTKIMSANPTPPDIYSETFLRVNKYDCEIYVPEGSAERYSHTDYWDVFHNFKESIPAYRWH